jgi:hypothetical protein
MASAFTVLVGVCVFAYRTDNAHLGDGHIGFSSVLLAGMGVLVPAVSLTAYLTMRRNREMVLPIGIVSIAVAVVTATGRPGNLFLVGWFLIIAVAVALLKGLELLIHRFTLHRRRA